MALSSFLPASPAPTSTSIDHQGYSHGSRHGHGQSRHHNGKQKQQHQQQQQQRKKKKQLSAPPKPPSSWEQLKSLITCRIVGVLSQVHDPSSAAAGTGGGGAKYTKLGSSCTYICALKDVVHGNSTRVVHHRGEQDQYSPDSCSSGSGPLGPETSLLSARSSSSRPASRSGGVVGGYSTAGAASSTSRGGLQLRKLSGCYECHAISEPRRYPTPRTISPCTECGEVFTKAESLELHQAIRHAVSELGPEDSGRNIVEIIFKSSWLKKDHPVCKIERILKVHNTQRTIARFEDYRDAVKAHAATALLQLGGGSNARQLGGATAAAAAGTKKNPRCAADGNELLRFHCTTLTCSLGARGSTSLCAGASSSAPSPCGVCTIVRHGFARAHQEAGKGGVRTTASSGRAHDCCHCPPGRDPDGGVGRRAMLVCRVIAGRVRRPGDEAASPEEGAGAASTAGFDSVATAGGAYTSLEELFVSNPRAILPCFVVIYRALC